MHGSKQAIALIAAASVATGLFSASAVADRVDGGLEEVFAASAEGKIISALVFLVDQADIKSLAAEQRADRTQFSRRNEEVVRTLRDTAELTQVALRNDLTAMRTQGDVQLFEPYWIANVVRVDATEPVLRAIAARPDVKRVYFNMPISNLAPGQPDPIEPGRGGKAQPIGSPPVPGVLAVRAPEVWNMGFTGEGVLIATIDTGVDGTHPALASRWRGLDPQYANNPEWAWFDPLTDTTFPQEFAFGSHGTHTMGSVLGGLPGEQVGVAPGAQWIHAGVIDRGGLQATIANAIASFQWMANPTGNPADWWAVPRVCSNSWGTTSSHGHPACDELFWQWIDNSEAAGTAQVFSAGNEGASGLRRPADRATNEYHSMAVGAIDPHDPNWPIGNFSSLGPTFCTLDGGAAIKPDISAPGVAIRSSVSGGGYSNGSGTSMASPHINGVLALMIQACDFLTADELKQIIYDTAHDLGAPGKNNTYGWGMVDAVEAVNKVLELCTIGIRLPSGAPALLDPGADRTFTVEVIEGNENIVPGSEAVFYRVNGGAFSSVPMTALGDGLYEAIIPAAACEEVIDYYVQVTGDGGTVRTHPDEAPLDFFTAHVGEIVTEMVLEQSFASGMPDGWSASGLWNVTGECEAEGECQGSQWAYYGHPSTCTYQTGSAPNSGELLSVAVTVPEIPPLGYATLSFCYNLITEPAQNFDVATFSVVGGESTMMTDSEQWTTFSTDITAHGGETIILRWHFDTFDGVANNFRGWQVDAVTVTVTGLACDDPTPKCMGDLNTDGVVDVSDLLMLLAAWGACPGCDADINNDGVVDVSDLLILLAAWGDC